MDIASAQMPAAEPERNAYRGCPGEIKRKPARMPRMRLKAGRNFTNILNILRCWVMAVITVVENAKAV